MLQSLIEKVDTMQEQIGNVNREMETLRKDQKETLEILKLKRKKNGECLWWIELRKESGNLKIHW